MCCCGGRGAGKWQGRVAALPRDGAAIAQQIAQAPGQGTAACGPRGGDGPVIDTFTRLSPAIEVRPQFRGVDVVDVLERVGREIGYPKTIRVDNGPEFVSKTLDLWAFMRGVRL